MGAIQKWGNSQGIRIPKSVLEQAGLRDNDANEISADKDRNIITKSHRHRTFAERMAGLKGDYSFTEMDSGEPAQITSRGNGL